MSGILGLGRTSQIGAVLSRGVTAVGSFIGRTLKEIQEDARIKAIRERTLLFLEKARARNLSSFSSLKKTAERLGVGCAISRNTQQGYSLFTLEPNAKGTFVRHEKDCPFTLEQLAGLKKGETIQETVSVGKKIFLCFATRKQNESLAFDTIPVVSRLDVSEKKEYGYMAKNDFVHFKEGDGAHLSPTVHTLTPSSDPIVSVLREKLEKSSRQVLDKLCLAAVVAGEGKVLMEHEGKLYAVVMKKGEGNTLQIEAKETSLADSIKWPKGVFQPVRETERIANETFLARASRVTQGKKVAQTSFFGGNTVVRLRIHDDSTVTPAVSEFIGGGSFGTVEKVQKFGVEIKEYARKTVKQGVKDFSAHEGLIEEGQVYLEYSHKHILKGRKIEELGEIIRDDDKKGVYVGAVAVQTETCDLGSCEEMETSPPYDRKEWEERGKVVYEAALGMRYIHEEKEKAIMDFKGANILRKTENGVPVAKLADLHPREDGAKDTAVTVAYLDMDAIARTDTSASRKCDVWALGIVLYNFAYGRDQNPIFAHPKTCSKSDFVKLFPEDVKNLREKLMIDTDPSHAKLNALLLQIFQLREQRPGITDDFLAELQAAITEFTPTVPSA